MKKITLTFIHLVLGLLLYSQVTVPPTLSSFFNPYNLLYLNNTDVKNFPCSNSFTNSLADNNILGETLNSNKIGISQNFKNFYNTDCPLGVFRIIDKDPPFNSKYFYTRFSGCEPTYNPTDACLISLHNSTFTNGEYLLSGTNYWGPTNSSGRYNPNGFKSYGIIGLTDLVSNKIKYYTISPVDIIKNVSWNPKGFNGINHNVDIIDAVRDNSNNIYGVGVVVNGMGNSGVMFIVKINSSNSLEYCIPIIDPNTPTIVNGTVVCSHSMIETMLPSKLYIDNTTNKLYVIGRNVIILPSPFSSFTSPFFFQFDLSNVSYKLSTFSNKGIFFDMKKAINGNYILGYQEDHFHEVGYLEVDDNVNIINQKFWDGSSITSASNIYNGGPNQLSSLFGSTKYSSLNIVDNDNIQLYGWNDNGMAFANINIGNPAGYAGSPSDFYGIVFGNNYISFPSQLSTFHNNMTTNFKFQEINGRHPLARKLMIYNNNQYEFYMNGEDNVLCTTMPKPIYSRMDKILTRTNNVSVNYNSTLGTIQSNFLQFVGTNASSPASAGYQDYEDAYNNCTRMFPMDYYSMPVNSYNLSVNNVIDVDNILGGGLEICEFSTGENSIAMKEEPLQFISDYSTDCNISSDVQYYQKSIAMNKSADEKIRNIAVYDITGKQLSINISDMLDTKFDSQSAEIVNHRLRGNKEIMIVHIETDKQTIKYKLKID